jgi:hypothetical protein
MCFSDAGYGFSRHALQETLPITHLLQCSAHQLGVCGMIGILEANVWAGMKAPVEAK